MQMIENNGIKKAHHLSKKMTFSHEDLYIDSMLMEYSKTHDKVCSLEKIAISFTTVVVAILGIIGTILFTSEIEFDPNESFHYLIAISFPLFVNSMLLLAAEYTVRTFSLGGYLKYIEEKINRKIGITVLGWETHFAHKEQTSLAAMIILFLFIIVFLLFCGVPFYLRYSPKYVLLNSINVINTISFVACVLALIEILASVLLFYQFLTAHKQVYQKCVAFEKSGEADS